MERIIKLRILEFLDMVYIQELIEYHTEPKTNWFGKVIAPSEKKQYWRRRIGADFKTVDEARLYLKARKTPPIIHEI